MRMLAAGLLGVAILGCGQGIAGATGATGSLSGSVTASPCRPVERIGDPPCPPVPNVQVDFIGSDAQTVSVSTDASGHYQVALRPGSYQVHVRSGFRSQPERVVVAARQSVALDLTFDSGLR